MVVLREGKEERLWFSRRGREPSPMKEAKAAHGWDVPEEPRQWCVFDLADEMEQGRGPGITLSFLDPPAKSQAGRNLRVQQMPRSGDYLLTTDKEEPMLLARQSWGSNGTGSRFEMFVTHDGTPPSTLGPSFVLESDASRADWVLRSVRCEQCEYRGKRQCGTRELARMTHYSEVIGEGEAYCMDVNVPEVGEDGMCPVLCSVCSDPAAATNVTQFTTRRPKWSPRHKTLTLEFHGRCNKASPTNFQLDCGKAGSPQIKANLLFGKVGSLEWVLDHSFPLSTVQAFAAALSASHWT